MCERKHIVLVRQSIIRLVLAHRSVAFRVRHRHSPIARDPRACASFIRHFVVVRRITFAFNFFVVVISSISPTSLRARDVRVNDDNALNIVRCARRSGASIDRSRARVASFVVASRRPGLEWGRM